MNRGLHMPDRTRRVLVTGAGGFIGRNLTVHLERRGDVEVLPFEASDTLADLQRMVGRADLIIHLAGVNRPPDDSEFETINTGLTRILTDILRGQPVKPPVIFASSIQAGLDNPYGRSKRLAETELINYNRDTGGTIHIFRLPNVFGKWCRPNYNSVVATFCNNIARGMKIRIDDPSAPVTLIYIDDVVRAFASFLDTPVTGTESLYHSAGDPHSTTVGELAAVIRSFRDMRSTLVLPDMDETFTRCLYATYLSYLETDDFSYRPVTRTDVRGSLTELLKSEHFGQIFVSTSRRGVLRGNHYHDTKVEKFCVLKGSAVIRLRQIEGGKVISCPVSGERIEIVDIPPGYTHSIENTGDSELVTLFWADEVFDPGQPDTFADEVEAPVAREAVT